MDSKDHINLQQSPGGKSQGAHVCTKCGWNYPNPHPSAKNRRSHKKICGTIKGYELLHTEKSPQDCNLQEEHCFDDKPKPPSPRVMEKADGRIGDISEEDVFADAVCEFSCSVVSDSFSDKGEISTNCTAKSVNNPGETQQFNSSSTGCTVKSSGVVQESCVGSPVEVLDNYDLPSSVEATSDIQQGEDSYTEGKFMPSNTLIESSQEAQVIEGGDTISKFRLGEECKGKLLEESESKLAYALGKREDTSNSSWNDEVIYSDVEGPHGFSLEATSMIHPGEDDHITSNSQSISPVTANTAQVISTSQFVPYVENADVSLQGTNALEESESNHSVNPCLHETPKGDECETDTLTQAVNLGIQHEGFSMGMDAPSSDKFLAEDKTKPQGQTNLVAKEFSSADNIMISKIHPDDIEMKAEEGESSFGAKQENFESETLIVSLPADADPVVVNSNADVSCAVNKAGIVDLVGHESELIQVNVVAEEENSPNSKLSSQSSYVTEKYASPMSDVFEGDEASDQRKCSTETSKGSALQIGADTYESNDEADRESCKGGFVEQTSSITVSSNAPDDTVNIANQKLLESGRTEFNRVVGGLGVIQGNEIAGNVKAQNLYAEVPVTIESNDHRDFGRLQNLSEAHIRSLVSSPLVTRNNTSHVLESNLGSVSGLSGGVEASESSSLAVHLSKSQEITMKKTTSWRTATEQHVPLKNLLSEARSPKFQQEGKNYHENNIPRVSSILGQETSPEDALWPERREVSEEWNSPAKYPVDLKKEERKVKGRPFWVPFVCCSSTN